MIEAYRVSWLARYLKALLESDLKLSNLWLEGEVSNLSRSTAGHTYFTLKDEDAQVRCVMFRRAYGGVPLENGDQVLAHGNVSFYQARGELQLGVDFGQPARKRARPRFPSRVGVVTAPAGAAFQDICHVIGRRWPLTEVVLAPTPVQGPEAAAGICEAGRQLNQADGIES